jgi:hypothetical protein
MGRSDSSSVREVEEEITSVEITILSRSGKQIYSVDREFTGKFSILFNQGGVRRVEKLERLK